MSSQDRILWGCTKVPAWNLVKRLHYICTHWLKCLSILIFDNLTKNYRSITRKHCKLDKVFIATEVKRLLVEQIFEPSTSPWQVQVVVVTNEQHKKKMVFHYCQTVNKFNILDACPLPMIKELVNKAAQYKIYNRIDLKSI